MTKEQTLALMKDRYNRLKDNPKDIKSGGCLKKLKRQILNMEAEM